MINISDSARDRLLYLLNKAEAGLSYVRVGVDSGGWSGLSYKLDFDKNQKDDDELIDNNGIKLLININNKAKFNKPFSLITSSLKVKHGL